MDKLQELTDKLYNEGLSKGKAEGERLLANAQAEAKATIAKAQAEADAIVAEANAKAEAILQKAASDVKTASAQAMQATKSDIENILLGGISAKPVENALSDPDFLKDIIKAVASQFSSSEQKDIALILPESLQDKLEPWVSAELSKLVSGKVEANFSKKVAGGFNIGPADGGWYVSLSDETFKSLISEYLRPVTKKILFGE